MASPGLPAVAAGEKARERYRRPIPGRQSNGDSLQTGLSASVAMAKGGKTATLGWIFAAAVLSLGAGAGAVSVPEAPSRVDLDVMSGSEVAVTFSAPLSDGGSAVQSYEVCVWMFACCWRWFGCRRFEASQ